MNSNVISKPEKQSEKKCFNTIILPKIATAAITVPKQATAPLIARNNHFTIELSYACPANDQITKNAEIDVISTN